jgi:hypothetical protein
VRRSGIECYCNVLGYLGIFPLSNGEPKFGVIVVLTGWKFILIEIALKVGNSLHISDQTILDVIFGILL